MRAAAAPLLPELVSLVEGDNALLRDSALSVLANMGTAARPALPKIRSLLTRKGPSEDRYGDDLDRPLDVIAAARPSAGSVMPAIIAAVRRYPDLFDKAAAVLVTLEAKLPVSARAVLRRGFDEVCADAGSIAYFSFSRDERCFVAAENLKKLGVLRP
jgi:hypothetical protein